MVAQQFLVLLVGVQIPVGLPFTRKSGQREKLDSDRSDF